MNLLSNHSLQPLNTFGFVVCAENYVAVANDEQLLSALEFAHAKNWPIFLLGGGSNLVLTHDIPGLVIHQTDATTTYQPQNDGSTMVTANAGKVWHELVLDTLTEGLVGLENLSLIPGNTGAAPVQNIGAYGVELRDRLHSLRAYHRTEKKWLTLTPADCQFAYRDSVFKQHPNEYVITQVSFELRSDTAPVTHYAALQRELDAQSEVPNTPIEMAKLISDTVIRIRQSKLPDPAHLGNAGSFFKNPVVPLAHAEKLKLTYPNLVCYPQPNDTVKLAAGWMIDQLGFKGLEVDGVGVHAEQALVLVNRGSGDGQALMRLANRIIEQVQANFSVHLEIEPVVL